MRPFYYTSRVAMIALSFVLSIAFISVNAQDEEFTDITALLSGLNENPVVMSPGSGEFEAIFVEETTGETTTLARITYTLIYRDLKGSTDATGTETPGVVTQAHIHIGKEWENGGVVVVLCSNLEGAPADTPACPQPTAEAPEATVMGTIEAGNVQAAGIGETAEIIKAGDFHALQQIMSGAASYVNLHTVAHPGGELRGPVLLEFAF